MNKKYSTILSLRKKVKDDWQKEFPNELPAKFSEISDIILILGSSRSGSSLLHHLLSQHPAIMSLQGEEVSFSKLYGLNEIISINDSDCITEEALGNRDALNAFRDEILLEAGFNNVQSNRFFRDISLRLILQWPEINFKLDDLKNAARLPAWPKVINYLQDLGYPVNLEVYDANFRDSSLSKFDEKLFLIEEPPFVIPQAKSYSSRDGKKERKILLLKSSVNAFRPELLLSIFPEIKFHFIHLTRNPAGAINGLIDGWLSNGFHTHNLSHLVRLNIDGYSSEKWWKFDLPPGWNEYINQPLEKVCAFQWKCSNQALLSFLETRKKYRWKYEDFYTPEKVRLFMEEIFRSLNIDSTPAQTIELNRHIMSVYPPNEFRWRQKEKIILPLLNDPEIASLCAKIGYDINNLSGFK